MKKLNLSSIGIIASAVLLAGASVGFAWTPETAGATKVTATCTNSTGDAATINSAISGSSAGDEIVIDGPCLINSPIKLAGDRTYRGDSRNTVLKQADGANLPGLIVSDSYLDNSQYTGNPIVLKDLTLNGNRSNNSTGTDGVIIRSWQTTVSDMQIANFSGHGLKVTNRSQNGTQLVNTQVNGRISNMFITDNSKNGVYVEDSGNSVTDWNLVDNWVASSGQSGIYMDNAAGWVVERNHVYGVPHNGIYANRAFGTAISDNYVEDFGRSTQTGTYYGVNATLQGDAATTMQGNRVFNFNGERAGSTYRYISISNVNYGTGVASVTGNAVRGANGSQSTGYYYSRGGNQLNVTSTGNNAVNVATPRTATSGVTLGGGV